MSKSIIVAFALLAVLGDCVKAFSEDSRLKLLLPMLNAGKECEKEHDISDEDIAVFKELNFPEGEDAKCFMACVFKNVGMMDKTTNKYTPERSMEGAKKILDDKDDLAKIEELLQSCNDVNNEDASDDSGCNQAKSIFTCLKSSAQKFGYDLSK